MNLASWTPRQIDEKLAELEGQLYGWLGKQDAVYETIHYKANDKKEFYGGNSRQGVWKMTDAKAKETVEAVAARENHPRPWERNEARQSIEKLAKVDEEIARWKAEIDPYEAEYDARPWNRFHQLRSTGAKIHRSRWCSALHRSNPGDLGWHPELSGKTEKEAVDELGPAMCSKCFPSAPVEWRNPPKVDDPDRCPGSGEVGEELQMQYYSPRGKCPVCHKGITPTKYGRTPKHKKPKN